MDYKKVITKNINRIVVATKKDVFIAKGIFLSHATILKCLQGCIDFVFNDSTKHNILLDMKIDKKRFLKHLYKEI